MNIQTFNAVYSIMEAAFPPSERRTREGQLELLNHEQYSVKTKENENGEIVAFLASWQFPTFSFIEHIAVSSSCRGQGLGKLLIHDHLQSTNKPTILEVEPCCDGITERRIRFYENLGFHKNDFPYMQPPLQKGEDFIPLDIMSTPSLLNDSEFSTIKEQLFREVYKLQ